MIEIISMVDGFRRCGIAHSREATTYPDDKFSADELKQLRAEPMLAVRLVDEPEPEKTPEPAKEPKKTQAKAPDKAVEKQPAQEPAKAEAAK